MPRKMPFLTRAHPLFADLYVFPRFSVLPGHEHKAFIPYSSIFGAAPKRRPHATASQGSSDPSSSRAGKQTESRGGNSSSGRNGQGGSLLEMGSKHRTTPSGSGDGLTPQAESSKLGLTSMPSLRHQPSNVSDTERSASVSSNGRSSTSTTDDSLFSSSASEMTNSTSWTRPDDVEPDAGNKTMEQAIVHDATTRAHAEEELGRPSLQVEELGEMMDKGVTLDDAAPDASETASPVDEQVAEGFEDSAPHMVVQATVTKITDTHVIVTPAKNDKTGASEKSATQSKKLWSIDSLSIPYTHLVYALGSHLPDPLRTVARTKPEGVSWMLHAQQNVKDAQRIVLVGGGALGVEYATDIKSVYPDKDVTLIHSRQRLLPNFDERIHEIARARLEELGVNLVLGERLALKEGCPQGSTTALDPEEGTDGETHPGQPKPIRKPSDALQSGLKRVRTTGGKEFICDLLMLCTGQQPNSTLMAGLSPTSVDPHTRLIRVHPTLQVALPPPEEAMPGPFDARPPCGDCDCFLDKKAAGGIHDEDDDDPEHSHGKQGKIPNVYAIGDVADAFGALNAGYQAWGMADVAAENIVRDIGHSASRASSLASSPVSSDAESEAESSSTAAVQTRRGSIASSVATSTRSRNGTTDDSAPTFALKGRRQRRKTAEMVHFNPAPNMLKLSLGLGTMVFQGAPVPHIEKQKRSKLADGEQGAQEEEEEEVEVEVMKPEVTIKDDLEDLGVVGVWEFMCNHSSEDLYL